MRVVLLALICAAGVCATDAQAQNVPRDEPIGATSVSASVGSVVTTPPAVSPRPVADPPSKPARLTWQKRFDQANTSHDGHLTLEEAKAGYASIARHFSAIDLTGKGYVTKDDIAAWHKTERASRKASPLPSQRMEPQHAFQRTMIPTLQINSATIKSLRQVPQPAAPVAAAPDPMTDNPTGDPR